MTSHEPTSHSGFTLLDRLSKIVNQVKTHGRWLGLLITIGAVGYAVFLVSVGWQQLSTLQWQNYIRGSLIAFICYGFSILVQMGVWLKILSSHHKIGLEDVKIYLHTILLRQIPGGVWHWAGRATWYHSKIPTRVIVSANFIEWLVLLASIPISYGVWSADLAWPFKLMLLLVGLTIMSILVQAWHAPQQTSYTFRFVDLCFWSFGYVFSWSMGGIILHTLLLASDISVTLPQSVTMWIIAGGVSSLTIIIPSGLGIREISLVFLLDTFTTSSIAILISVLLRVIFIASDLLWGGFGYMILSFILPSHASETSLSQR